MSIVTSSNADFASTTSGSKPMLGYENPARWTPSDPVRRHLNDLMEVGFSREEISRRSDVNAGTIGHIAAGTRARTRLDVAQRILSIPLDLSIDGHERHLPWPSQRRLWALIRNEWPIPDLAQRAGMQKAELRQVTTNSRAFVLSEQVMKINKLYDELKDVPGHRPQSRLLARQKGWPPPQAWTPEELDDLDELTTERVKLRWKKTEVSTPGELLADLIEVNDYTLVDIARLINVSEPTPRAWVADRVYPRGDSAKRLKALLKVDTLPTPASQKPGPKPRTRTSA